MMAFRKMVTKLKTLKKFAVRPEGFGKMKSADFSPLADLDIQHRVSHLQSCHSLYMMFDCSPTRFPIFVSLVLTDSSV